MPWLIGFACFLVGGAAGALLFKIFKSDEARVSSLQAELTKLSEEHENYKNHVHTHFSNSARLLNEMTDSYRNVYQHMAAGAQSLCPDYISSQLSLSSEAKALLDNDPNKSNLDETQENTSSNPAPPRDYAEKSQPDQKGSLSEDYGIEKPENY